MPNYIKGKGKETGLQTDYYDVTDERVKEWVITDLIIEHETIEVKDEPLLKPLSDIDEDFGFGKLRLQIVLCLQRQYHQRQKLHNAP